MFDTARWVLSREKKFLDSVNMVMKAIAWAIPVFVTGLKLRHLNIDTGQFYHVLESTPVASWVLGLSLVMFYSSWILGAYFDIGTQKEVYVFPSELKLTLRDVGVMLAVAVTFGVLGFFLDRPVIFSAVLLVYWSVNVLAWRYLVANIVTVLRKESAQRHSQDSHYLDLAKLAVVRQYIEGTWQWWRLAVGGVLAVALLGFAVFGGHVSLLRSQPSIPQLLVVAIMFFVFVLIVESWMWFKRLVTILRLACFDDLGREYEFIPKQEPQKPSPAQAPAPVSPQLVSK